VRFTCRIRQTGQAFKIASRLSAVVVAAAVSDGAVVVDVTVVVVIDAVDVVALQEKIESRIIVGQTSAEAQEMLRSAFQETVFFGVAFENRHLPKL